MRDDADMMSIARMGLVAALSLLAGCGTPPAPTVPSAAVPTRTAVDPETVLTATERQAYARALLEASPAAIAARINRHDDGDTAARYLVRDGVHLCESIAAGEDDDVVARQTAARFDVPAADAGKVRAITEQQVCPKL